MVALLREVEAVWETWSDVFDVWKCFVARELMFPEVGSRSEEYG